MKMGESEKEVMYITVTTLKDGEDYTVILNGLPTLNNLKRMCERDEKAAILIIKTLCEKAVEDAREYWSFDLASDDEFDEWTDNLDTVLGAYLTDLRSRKEQQVAFKASRRR